MHNAQFIIHLPSRAYEFIVNGRVRIVGMQQRTQLCCLCIASESVGVCAEFMRVRLASAQFTCTIFYYTCAQRHTHMIHVLPYSIAPMRTEMEGDGVIIHFVQLCTKMMEVYLNKTVCLALRCVCVRRVAPETSNLLNPRSQLVWVSGFTQT